MGETKGRNGIGEIKGRMGREREWKLLSKTVAKPANTSPKKLNWAQYQ